MNPRSRRGSYIAEAALVLPISMLAIITIVLVLLFFYQQSVETSRLHQAIRCKAGEVTERTIYYSDKASTDGAEGLLWDGSISVKSGLLFKSVNGSKDISMLHWGILWGQASALLEGSCYAADGVKVKRLK